MTNPPKKLLVANRGEVAVRIARAARESGWRSVAVFSVDDAAALHTRLADEALPLPGNGPRAYLDIDAVISAAREAGCDALHPGYGFLAENGGLARRCESEGLRFVGPSPRVLDLFGDKASARDLARQCGVPLIDGSAAAVTAAQAHAFFSSLPPGAAMMIKAVAGGGGRGMREVFSAAEIDAAHARCAAESRAAFGSDAVYVERLIVDARHIEVQLAGDRHGGLVHLGERECSIQRRHQKLIEIAPSPSLSQPLRQRIVDAALALGRAAKLDNLCTMEFLIDAGAPDEAHAFAFIEANPRLQVEHTVTEMVLGIDLVQLQLALASGATLAELDLADPRIAQPRGRAMQLRINAETLDATGHAQAHGGVMARFEPPVGPGVRVDSGVGSGDVVSTAFDSLVAKLVVHSPSLRFVDLVAKARRALDDFRIDGVATNLPLLRALLTHPDLSSDRINTRFIDDRLAVLALPAAAVPAAIEAPAGRVAVTAPLQGTVAALHLIVGQGVQEGSEVAVLEAMKMQHPVTAPCSGIVREVLAEVGRTLDAGAVVALIEPSEGEAAQAISAQAMDPAHIRPDLAEVMQRHAFTQDAYRSAAVTRRHATGQRTARENVAHLFDAGSFVEYGALAVAAQRGRRTLADLIENTPADGVVAGIGTVNAALVGAERARCMGVVYDYTVLAGTQGHMNHKKQDRMFGLAARLKLPVVLYAEGGGGRPGDTDRLGLTGLDAPTFAQFARLSGQVPLVGVVSGRCFAGNAALLGCCDVIIATRDASIGMGGPAMIEGGGLGVVKPEDVGPAPMHAASGVVDVLVGDEAQATDVARRYLSYFQGPVSEWQCADQRLLRQAIPENRKRAYDMRAVIDTLADTGTVLELRRGWAAGMITALVRIEGQPLGLIANNPAHLGGAIDAPACDKAARFMRLCNAFGLPILSLCDTPGFMVGPEAEKTGLVRHTSSLFLAGAALKVPLFTVVLRKAYGLGAMAMAGGSFHEPQFTIAWPTGEVGGMGLEGYARLGFRKEMEAIADPAERQAWFEAKVASLYEEGKALSIASVLEIDGVIDPARTRGWVVAGMVIGVDAAKDP